jgi:hypothetical protein
MIDRDAITMNALTAARRDPDEAKTIDP